MKNVTSSNVQQQTGHALIPFVVVLALVFFGLPIFTAIGKGIEVHSPDANAIETVTESAERPTMSLDEWAGLEYAQTCMRTIKDPVHCAEYTAEFTAEELAMDLTQVEIR